MSLRHAKASGAHHRRWVRILLAAAVVVLILTPGIAGAGAGTGGDTDDDAQMVADAKLAESAIVAGYNDKKWDELRALYSEAALLLPPNHEPVQGRDAIIEYFQSIRDVTGEIDDGVEYLRLKGSGNFAVLAGKITFQSGRVRMTYNDLYERQPDGSVLLAVNQIAFR
jgi:ketosteroid isomerase-like protein